MNVSAWVLFSIGTQLTLYGPFYLCSSLVNRVVLVTMTLILLDIFQKVVIFLLGKAGVRFETKVTRLFS